MVAVEIAKVLTEAWISHLIWRFDPHVKVADLFGDARPSRKREMRLLDLVATGYLTQNEEGDYLATERAFTEFEGKAPLDTIASLLVAAGDDERHLDHVHGRAFNHLSVAEQRWVCEHRSDYAFVLVDFDQHPAEINPFAHDWTVRDRAAGTLYVAPVGLLEAKVARLDELHFAKAFGRNLAWGLTKVGVIASVDADAFEVRTGGAAPFASDATYFSGDPERWQDDAERIVRGLRERIARDQRKANAILAAVETIRKRGGWETVLEEYRAALAEETKA